MIESNQQINVNSEERLFGLFSHLSIFFGGIVLPIIFWAINKDKSKFVTFHSLQALFFHISYVFVIIIFAFLLAFAGVGLGFLSTGFHSAAKSGPPILFILLIVIFYLFLFLVIAGVIGLSIYMGIKAYQGELKKYPIIGSIVYKKVYGAGIS